MVENFYRFRSLKWLLNGEIDNLSMYVAGPDELNDPLEGLKNIYWQGDEIVWKNLFRHYVRCVSFQYHELLSGAKKFVIPSTLDWSRLSDDFRPIVDYAVELFLEDVVTRKYIEMLAQGRRKVFQSELKVYLYSSHHFAIYCAQKALVQFKAAVIDLTQGAELNETRLRDITQFAACTGLILKMPKQHEHAVSEFFDNMVSFAEEAHILKFVNHGSPMNDKARLQSRMYSEFVSSYVKSLEQLMYPDWYVACFMTDCSNSSIWGTYGEKHTGACLKYKLPKVGEDYVLPLKKPDCFPDMDQDTNLKLRKVSYDTAPIELSFFESIANVPERWSMRDWYTDGDKTTPMRKWMDDFSVSDFNAALTVSTATKLDAWQHENEYRALLTSYSNISEPECRSLTYDFDLLDGVIFGIKMSSEDKASIVSKFLVHIKRAGRVDFKFYQAYFDQMSKSIKYKELSLLREQLERGASS